MIKLCDNKICTGCASCAQSCPKGCINLIQNDEGFYYPQINDESCISCKKCVNSCPILNRPKISMLERPVVYGIYSNNPQIHKDATSGGIFYQIAHNLIKQGYTVYGVAYDEYFNPLCTRAVNEKELNNLIGSKYIQANPNDVYKSVKKDLLNGIKVFYCGTPCQVAGLYAFLGKNTKGLITADIVCHGVPSLKLWMLYLDYLKSKKINVISYSFRDKTKWGWGSWGSYIFKKNNKTKKHYFPVAADYYYSLFFKENCLRESCYDCKFNGDNRVSDFTIGDYWGIDEAHPGFYDRNGVSVVVLNSSVAVQLFKDNENYFKLIESTYELATKNNKTIIESTKRPESRDFFYSDLNNLGFEKTAKKYVHLRKIVPYISRYVPRNVKRSISKRIPKLSRKMVDS